MAESAIVPLIKLPAGGMDLAATLFCGQSFSWREEGGGRFVGVAGPRAARVWAEADTVCIETLALLPGADASPQANENFWRHYFALDTNWPALLKKYAQHKKLAECVAAGPGIRVLRQPFFETLLCFIVSQNNHIPRITSIAGRLREEYGAPLGDTGLFAYPTPQRLAALSVEELVCLRAGFRAKYLLDAARKVAAGEVDEARLGAESEEEARAELCRIHGVGVKVADCVLLYSLGRDNVVPMDVWMKRAMEKAFPRGMPRVAKGTEGLAQQFIFCWARQNL